MSWGPFCLQVGRREAGREAEAPFRHSASWWAEWGRGYSCVDSHKSLTMWLGQRAREGSRGRSFLSLGVWVLGGEQHRVLGGGVALDPHPSRNPGKRAGGWPEWSCRKELAGEGTRAKHGAHPDCPPGRPARGARPLFPAPSPLARRGPSPQAGRRLPLPSSPSHPALQLLPTAHSARSEWRSRTREASSARAREPGAARAGERRSARVRGVRVPERARARAPSSGARDLSARGCGAGDARR